MFPQINRCFSKKVLLISRRFQSNATHYDIIIAGGGMVGTTLAATLGKNVNLASKRILLLEGTKKTDWKLTDKYSNRVSSINSAGFELLNEIGAWKHIADARFNTVERLQVWDGISNAAVSFDKCETNEPICYVVENDLILNAAQKVLNGVDVVYEAKIQTCSATNETTEAVSISMQNGDKYTCDLLLGCDGTNSIVAKAMDFHNVSKNYNHMGIVATLQLDEETENVVAWQRQLPDSTFVALLPLKPGLSSLVWSTHSEEAKKLVNLPEDQFVDAINDALSNEYPRLGVVDSTIQTFDNLIRFLNLPSSSMKQLPPRVVACDSRAMFPLGFKHSTNYVSKGVALVGDAAHRIHPLAGQGVNLGFGDVLCLNRILGEAAYSGTKLGSLQYLKDYERERQRHNIPIMLVVDGMWQMYATQFTPLVILRSLGLQTAHAVGPLKKLIINHASGQPLFNRLF